MPLVISGATSGATTLESTDGSNATITLPNETGRVLTSGGAIDVNASAPADSVVINSSGNVTVNTGNLVIGQAGRGIDFDTAGSGAAANLLDDYEEGTWTPTMGNGTYGTTAFSLTNNGSSYVKIGRKVSLQFNVTLTHTANTNGTNLGIRHDQFPFQTDVTTYKGLLGMAYLNSVTGAANGGVVLSSSSTVPGAGPSSASWSWFAANPTGTSGTSTWVGMIEYFTT